MYKPQQSLPNTVKAILTVDEEIRMQRDNLLRLLQMIVMKGDCWHKQIEDVLCNPYEPPLLNYDNCNNGCPSCLSIMSDYIMPVNTGGLSCFLADTFINNASESLSPDELIKKLSQYPDVGRVVYNRPRSPKAPVGKFVMVTVLQLIASRLIELQFADKTYEYTCRLVVIGASRAYLDDTNWSKFFTTI